MKRSGSYSVLTKDGGESNRQGQHELDKSGNSIKSVLSALSLSISKNWSKTGSSNITSVRSRNKPSSPKEDISELPEEIQDEYRLYRSLQDAGRNTDGVDGVEVWVLDRSENRLVQPPGGFWCSPYFKADDYEALARIKDKDRDDYVPAPPLLPGTGLAGTLWNEERNLLDNQEKRSQKQNNFSYYTGINTNSLRSRGQSFSKNVSGKDSTSSFSSHSSSVKSFQSMTNMLHTNYRSMGRTYSYESEHGLAWRDIRSVNIDPYMPTFLRLELMEVAGFKKCTGIHFDLQGTSGIVLFLARDDIRVRRLNLRDNVAYMKASANLVGATAALVKHRIKLNSRVNRPQTVQDRDSKERTSIYSNVAMWLKKCRGGDLQPPPPMSLDEVFLTFMGVFVTLMILHGTSSWLESVTGAEFVFGPFGALLTLQFGLTMAPPAQPRNIMLGQITATVMALTIPDILERFVDQDIAVSFTVASVIGIMVMTGTPHPPAGATALIISRGNFGWSHLPIVIFSNSIAIVTSTLINNLSAKRQYPTYVRMGESILKDAIFGCCAPKGSLTSGDFNEKRRLLKRASSLLSEASFAQNHELIDNSNMKKQLEPSERPFFSSEYLDTARSKNRTRTPSFLQNTIVVQNIDQVKHVNSSTVLLEPMDWSGGALSTNSSKVQIIVDEEIGDLDIDVIENEASGQYSSHNLNRQLDIATGVEDYGIGASNILSANTINEEFAQKYEHTFQPKKELSPLKEATQDKHDGEPKMDLSYRYGSMFMIPTLEPSTKTGSEEDLDDDLSLESLDVDF